MNLEEFYEFLREMAGNTDEPTPDCNCFTCTLKIADRDQTAESLNNVIAQCNMLMEQSKLAMDPPCVNKGDLLF